MSIYDHPLFGGYAWAATVIIVLLILGAIIKHFNDKATAKNQQKANPEPSHPVSPQYAGKYRITPHSDGDWRLEEDNFGHWKFICYVKSTV